MPKFEIQFLNLSKIRKKFINFYFLPSIISRLTFSRFFLSFYSLFKLNLFFTIEEKHEAKGRVGVKYVYFRL